MAGWAHHNSGLRWAVAWALVASGGAGLTVGSAQEDPDGPRPAVRRRDPQRVQQRLDELIEQGASEDDPRVQKLRGVLQRLQESGDRPGRRSRKSGGHRRYSPEALLQFVEAHDALRELLAVNPDGTPVPPERLQHRLRRFGRQLSEIMDAFEAGDPQRGEKMIASATIQYAIGQKLHDYHQRSDGDVRKAQLRDELAALVEQRVAIELEVEALKLSGLRQRLERQEQRLDHDRERQSEIVAKKLDLLLSGKPPGPRRGWRHDGGGDDPPAGDPAPAPPAP